jgi:hypothetical protein
MAKKRKASKAKPNVENENADPFSGSEPAASATGDASAKGTGFFRQLGDGLKAAGQAAERMARVGVSVAELEKLRLELKMAYAKLGESIIKCWDAAPDIGVAANDPAVKDPVKAVKDLRRRIREIEIKIKTLQAKN